MNTAKLDTLFQYFRIEEGLLYWRIKPNKSQDISKPISCLTDSGYIVVRLFNVLYRAHRIMYQMYHNMDDISDIMIDHIDGDKLNNRKENLRECDKSTNGMNRGKQRDNTTNYKGVTYHKGGKKYLAQLHHLNKHYYLGLHDTPELAYEAYCKKAKEIHGEFFHG